MLKKYRGFEIGDFIKITNYAGCALWVYDGAYATIGKETPHRTCEDKNKVWRLKRIIRPFEISSHERRTLFYLESGDDYVIVEVPRYNTYYEKISTYFLKYNKKP